MLVLVMDITGRGKAVLGYFTRIRMTAVFTEEEVPMVAADHETYIQDAISVIRLNINSTLDLLDLIQTIYVDTIHSSMDKV